MNPIGLKCVHSNKLNAALFYEFNKLLQSERSLKPMTSSRTYLETHKCRHTRTRMRARTHAHTHTHMLQSLSVRSHLGFLVSLASRLTPTHTPTNNHTH